MLANPLTSPAGVRRGLFLVIGLLLVGGCETADEPDGTKLPSQHWDSVVPIDIDHSAVLVSVGPEAIVVGVIGGELVAQWAGTANWQRLTLGPVVSDESKVSLAAAGAPDGRVYVALGQAVESGSIQLISFMPGSDVVTTVDLPDAFEAGRRNDLYIGLEGPPLDVAVTASGQVDVVYRSHQRKVSRARWADNSWETQQLYDSEDDELMPGEEGTVFMGAGLEIVHDDAGRLFVNASRGMRVSQGGAAMERGNTGWVALRADNLEHATIVAKQNSLHERMRSRRARIAVDRADHVYVGPAFGTYAAPNNQQSLSYGVEEVSGQQDSQPHQTKRDPRLTNFTGQIHVNACGEVRTLDNAAFANTETLQDGSWWQEPEEDRAAHSCPTFPRSRFVSSNTAPERNETLGESRYGHHRDLMICPRDGRISLCGPDVIYREEQLPWQRVARLVGSTPGRGAVVSADIEELTLRFDQPGSGNLSSFCVHDIDRVAGGVCAGGSYSSVGAPTESGGYQRTLDLSRTTFSLKPGRNYRLAFGEVQRAGDYWAVQDDEVPIVYFSTAPE